MSRVTSANASLNVYQVLSKLVTPQEHCDLGAQLVLSNVAKTNRQSVNFKRESGTL